MLILTLVVKSTQKISANTAPILTYNAYSNNQTFLWLCNKCSPKIKKKVAL